MSIPNNPVQYFYKREVQEKFSFNEKNHYTMDLEFLANVLKIYEKNIRYTEEIFGNYILLDNAKSVSAQKKTSHWDKSTFSYIDELIKFEPWYKNYFEDREREFIKKINELIKNKKRVLVFSPVPLYPTISGNRKRMVNMLNKIKENDVELFLVLFGSDWIDGKNISKEQIDMDYKKLFAKVFHYPKKRDHSSLFGKNIDIDDAYEDGLGEYISNICKDYKIDIYLHNYIFQSKVFEFLPYSVIKILDTHDKFKDKYKLAKWYSYSEEEESKGISRADIILSIQDEEKKYFESITNKEVVTVGHLSESNFLDKEYENLKVIGIISSGHIRDFLAVEKFIQKFIEVVPEDLTLNIAGMVCEKLEPLYKHPQINYLGLVNDLRDFYESINLCVIPPEDGTGLKIKSVEALSYGVPIISTKHGFIGIKSNEKFHQADSVDELLSYIQEIKDNNNLLKDLKKSTEKVFNIYQSEVQNKLDEIVLTATKKQIIRLKQELEQKQKIIQEKNKELNEKQNIIDLKTKELEEKNRLLEKKINEIQAIYSSKKYRLANTLAKPYVFIKKSFKGK